MLKPVMVYCHKNKIGRLAADLQAETRTSHLNEDRRAPTVARSAAENSLTVLCANHKSSLFKAGNYGNARGFTGDALRNAFVWCTHQFVKNSMTRFNAIIQFLQISRICDVSRKNANTNDQNHSFHDRIPPATNHAYDARPRSIV